MSKFKKYGCAGNDYNNLESAKGDTYTKKDGSFPPTNLACKENPYIKELYNSKYILELGCGVGRNISWIMDNTSAIYVGLDPNNTMTQYIWDVQKAQGYDIEKWKNRVIICNSFEDIPNNIKFDYVFSTFVMQHLGYRHNKDDIMNLDEITQNIRSFCHDNTVWFSIEHDSEEDWIPVWKRNNEINFNVYIRGYKGLPELTDRDHTAPNGGHHLFIFKFKK